MGVVLHVIGNDPDSHILDNLSLTIMFALEALLMCGSTDVSVSVLCMI